MNRTQQETRGVLKLVLAAQQMLLTLFGLLGICQMITVLPCVEHLLFIVTLVSVRHAMHLGSFYQYADNYNIWLVS